ncbi:MAG TPA: PEP-CTERM sorting domain-containing protein [Phycisphaerae bacterium]|nr:PEP-CTERM sorting domain-containing protein [Phycisphaerae bacterium]
MKGKLLFGLVLACAITANGAFLSENFDSGDQDGWTIANDSGGLGWAVGPSPSGVPGDLAWVSYDGLISRIAKPFDAAGSDVLVLEYDFYTTSTSATQRAFGGLADCSNPGSPGLAGLVRIGTSNKANYDLHYYTTALQQVSTGVPLAVGWHHVKIVLTFDPANPSNTKLDWTLDSTSGSATGAIAKPAVWGVVLGYNYSNGSGGDPDTSTWYDNVMVTPEPAALILLSLGTLLCGRRRRA